MFLDKKTVLEFGFPGLKLNQLSWNRAHVSYRGDKRLNNEPSQSSTKKEANQCFRRGR